MFPIRDTVPGRTKPTMSVALILVNAAVFLFELRLPPDQQEALAYVFGLVPARYTNPEWASWLGLSAGNLWPFVTHMFLHGGWLHVIANMWTLWLFGDNVEDRMGPGRFLVFYLVCGVIAGVIQFLTSVGSAIPMVGASGAIAGVMGAYFFMFPKARLIMLVPLFFFPLFFEVPAVLYLGLWFVGQIFSGTLSSMGPAEVGGIAFWAHAGGFAAGMALHPIFKKSRRQYRPWCEDEVLCPAREVRSERDRDVWRIAS